LAFEAFDNKEFAESRYSEFSYDLPIEYQVPDDCKKVYVVHTKSPTSSVHIHFVSHDEEAALKCKRELDESYADQNPPPDPEFPDYRWETIYMEIEIQTGVTSWASKDG